MVRCAQFFIVLMSAWMVLGCSNDDKVVPVQQKDIESFLRGKNYEHEYAGGVYRYIANANRPGYSTSTVAANGDEVTCWFELTPFSAYKSESSNTPRRIVYTNRAEIIEDIDEDNKLKWSTDPMVAKIGSSTMIKGLSRGLDGCREGDSVILIITSDLAYGDKAMGLVPQNSPIVYILKIDNVKK